MVESQPIDAGDFSEWLRSAETTLRTGNGTADVPCGDCTACCRSSMFIHIQPAETRSLASIPRKLLFPAPGLPKGNVVMGYDGQGRCPMLAETGCSIYQSRPQTCRSYDCRIFAATGISARQPPIVERVKRWVFRYQSEESRREHLAVGEAAAFLEQHKALFPKGFLPGHPAQLAILALLVFRTVTEGKRSGAPAPSIVRTVSNEKRLLSPRRTPR